MRPGSDAFAIVIDGHVGAAVAHTRATDPRHGPDRFAYDPRAF
jgi:hypothetical protein